MSSLPAAFLLSILALSGCGGAESPTVSASSDSPWELVYERIVDGNQDLYVSRADGSAERRLTDDPATDGLPRFTRDGRGVLFTSNRTGNFQLYEVSAEGGAARRLRTSDSTEWQADESPDGSRIAFLSRTDGSEALSILDRRSGTSRMLLRHGKTIKGRHAVLGNPHWSADGRRIVLSSNWEWGHQIYLADADSGKANRISPLTSGGCEPRLRPDGRTVVYVSRRLWKTRSRLVDHDLETGRERVVVDWPALNYDPVYSPDGSELAFASDIAGGFAIYCLRLADGHAWRVTTGAGPARYPDYRPRRP